MRYLYVLSLVLVLFSCKKSRVVIQTNDVIAGNGSGCAGMRYEVVEKSTPFFEAKVKTVAEGVLDENGHAAFDLKMKNNKQYVLGVEQPDTVHFGNENFLMNYLENEKNNVITINYAMRTYLKIIINNTNCGGANDTMRLYLSDDIGVIDSEYFREHLGCAYWETSGGVDGGLTGYHNINYGNLHYKWEVTRNGVTTTFYDTQYYDKGQRYTYQIDY